MRASAAFEVFAPSATLYVIGLGANLGDPERTLRAAVANMEALPEVALLARSHVYRSAAMGPPQPDYLNAAVKVRGTLSAPALLEALQRIENAYGRTRELRWGPRTLDLDILWSEVPFHSDNLVIPHLELTRRWWALRPLLDVAPELSSLYGSALAELGSAPKSVFEL